MDSDDRPVRRAEPPGRRAPRCGEVTRELATPTGAPGPAAVAEHLASCPACASWGRRATVLDRLWDATRPAAPPSSSWDALWAEIAAAAAAAPVPVAPSRRRRAARVLIGALAAAAALMVAVSTAWRPAGREDRIAAVRAAPTALPRLEFEVETGQLLTLHLDGPAVAAVQRPQEEVSETETVPWDLELYNGVESISMAANGD